MTNTIDAHWIEWVYAHQHDDERKLLCESIEMEMLEVQATPRETTFCHGQKALQSYLRSYTWMRSGLSTFQVPKVVAVMVKNTVFYHIVSRW